MSENVRSQKWLAISFFLACNLVFFALVYTIVSRSTDSAYSNWMGSTGSNAGTNSNNANVSVNGVMVLLKGHPVELENLQLTYRGLSSGVLLLDLVLLDLDPQYVYHRQIPVAASKQGVQVSDRRFKVISVSRQRLKLLLIKPSL